MKYWKVCISLQLAGEVLGLSQLLFGELSLMVGPIIVKMQKSMKMLLIANAVQLAQCGPYNTEIYVCMEIYLLPDDREHFCYQTATKCDFCNSTES